MSIFRRVVCIRINNDLHEIDTLGVMFIQDGLKCMGRWYKTACVLQLVFCVPCCAFYWKGRCSFNSSRNLTTQGDMLVRMMRKRLSTRRPQHRYSVGELKLSASGLPNMQVHIWGCLENTVPCSTGGTIITSYQYHHTRLRAVSLKWPLSKWGYHTPYQ